MHIDENCTLSSPFIGNWRNIYLCLHISLWAARGCQKLSIYWELEKYLPLSSYIIVSCQRLPQAFLSVVLIILWIQEVFLISAINTGSVCKKSRIFAETIPDLCWAPSASGPMISLFLYTIFESGLLIDRDHRAKMNVISDIEKFLKWIPVVYARI